MPNPFKSVADATVLGAGGGFDDVDPSIVALSTGGFFVIDTKGVSASDPDIDLNLYASAGMARFDVDFPPSPTADETEGAGAELRPGKWAFVWAVKDDTSGQTDVYFSLGEESAGGTTLGAKSLVNVGSTTGVQDRPQIAAAAGDRFVVAWIDRQTSRVMYAIYSETGAVVVGPTVLSTAATAQDFGSPTFRLGMATLADGTVAISYRTDSFDSRFSIVASNGYVFTPDIDVDGAAGLTGPTDIAAMADGRVFVAFRDANPAGGSTGLSGRFFNKDGTAAGAEFSITTSAGDYPHATQLLDGRLFVTWQFGGDIFAQIVLPDGSKVDAPFVVNTVTTGIQERATCETLADGRVAVSWTSDESGSRDVKLAIYDPREEGVSLAGTSQSDDYIGTAFDDVFLTGAGNDRLFAGAGNDRLNGGSGADFMAGGAGDDWYTIDDPGDVVAEFDNEGNDVVFSSISYVMGNSIEQTILTGYAAAGVLGNVLNNNIAGNNAANGLAGGGGNDVIFGLGGNDSIDGGLGADIMQGGTGADNYFVDNAGDLVSEDVNGGEFDTVFSTISYILPTNVETLILNAGSGAINGIGNASASGVAPNLMLGNDFANGLVTFGGNDVIVALGGNDTIDAGAGNDLVSGGDGADTLTGGLGHDFFAYAAITEGGDLIRDFTTAAGANLDLLDLRVMFTTFTGAFGATAASAIASGHLTLLQSGADTLVYADANGGAHPGAEQVFIAQLQSTTVAGVQATTLVA